MSIFNRILFAGDLSEPSREAFGAACSIPPTSPRVPGRHSERRWRRREPKDPVWSSRMWRRPRSSTAGASWIWAAT